MTSKYNFLKLGDVICYVPNLRIEENLKIPKINDTYKSITSKKIELNLNVEYDTFIKTLLFKKFVNDINGTNANKFSLNMSEKLNEETRKTTIDKISKKYYEQVIDGVTVLTNRLILNYIIVKKDILEDGLQLIKMASKLTPVKRYRLKYKDMHIGEYIIKTNVVLGFLGLDFILISFRKFNELDIKI